MRKPFNGNFPITRGFIKHDLNMPRDLWDPLYGPTHRGIDYALPRGTEVVAADRGLITYAQFSSDGAGNCVVIKVAGYLVKYFHLDSIAVRLGDTVREGQIVGTSGQSGNARGPHLHFQVEQGLGNAIDPAPLMTGSMESIEMASKDFWRDSIWHECYPHYAKTQAEADARPGSVFITDDMIAPYVNMDVVAGLGRLRALDEVNARIAATQTICSGNVHIDQVAEDVKKLRATVANAGSVSEGEAQQKLEEIKSIVLK